MPEPLNPGLPVDELQAELRDLLSLTVAGNHMRWVLIGEGAPEFREGLTDAVTEWRVLAEDVAMHMVALGAAPDGRVRSLAEDISLNWVPDGWLPADEGRLLMAGRLRKLAAWARYRRSQAVDSETVRLLNAVCVTLEHAITSTWLRSPSVRSA